MNENNTPEKKNNLDDYLLSNTEAIADSQRLVRMIKDYLEEENEQRKAVILAEMVMSKEWGKLKNDSSFSTNRGEITSPADNPANRKSNLP